MYTEHTAIDEPTEEPNEIDQSKTYIGYEWQLMYTIFLYTVHTTKDMPDSQKFSEELVEVYECELYTENLCIHIHFQSTEYTSGNKLTEDPFEVDESRLSLGRDISNIQSMPWPVVINSQKNILEQMKVSHGTYNSKAMWQAIPQ